MHISLSFPPSLSFNVVREENHNLRKSEIENCIKIIKTFFKNKITEVCTFLLEIQTRFFMLLTTRSIMNNFETDLFDSKIGPQRVLTFQVWLGLGIIAIKRYPTLSISSELELHHQIQFCAIPRRPFFRGGVILSSGNVVSIF